jgi:hypothetical protein
MEELTVVRTLKEIDYTDVKIPMGTVGTVVFVYAKGSQVEVEFPHPWHVVTMDIFDLATTD